MGRSNVLSQKSSTPRAEARLEMNLEKRLLSYAAAAVAAGVGVLGCSPQAEAKVIYVNTWVPIAPVSSVSLDLTNDGVADFQFSNNRIRTSNCIISGRSCLAMNVLPQNQGNAVWGSGSSASALGSGVRLGSQGQFQAGHQFMAKEGVDFSSGAIFYSSTGPWKQATSRFLGLKFVIDGQFHYGWARLDVNATNHGIYAALTGYAYETEPNTPILTGQKDGTAKKKPGKRASASSSNAAPTTGSLGMLARGTSALGQEAQDATRR
jgi:hypothetical protein